MHLHRAWGGVPGLRQERQGHPHPPGPILCQDSGNHGPHFLDQLSGGLSVHSGGTDECLEGMLALLAPGWQKDKLVLGSRTLY